MTQQPFFSGPELLLELDRSDGRPLYARLENALRRAIRTGRLEPGARLPSTRALAGDLSISRGTVIEAYAQLSAEGYLVGRVGSGTRVAALPRAGADTASQTRIDDVPRWDFRPGLPDPATFPRSAWSAASRRALQGLPDRALAYPPAAGAAALREALAAYLRRVRGVDADPARIVICAGFAQGVALVGQVLKARGVDVVGIEDPGYWQLPRHLAFAGLDVEPIATDEQGVSTDAVASSGVEAVVVTPAHQFPTGVLLSPSRRASLIGWATKGRGLVIEDDYDAEFRYDRPSVGALQGLASDQVIYAGSVSKTLSPALRLGWLVLPTSIVEAVIEAKAAADLGAPLLPQLALAQMLGTAAYDRHVRRVRRLYRQRRDALVAALAHHAPDIAVHGLNAGLHAVARLPEGVDESALVKAAAERSVATSPLRAYRLGSSSGRQGALVLGYGALSEAVIENGIARLAEALEEVRGSRAVT